MKALLTLLAALAIAIAAAVAFAPATLVDSRIAAATAGRARLADAKGTAWHGAGTLVDARGLARIPVQWDASMWAFARGAFDADVRIAGAPAPARIRADGERWRLERLVVRLPAGTFGDAGTLGGDVRIAAEALDIARGEVLGTLRIDWHRARIAPSPGPVIDLGTVATRLSGARGTLSGPLEARGGEVVVDGTVVVDSGAVRLDAQVAPASSSGVVVREMLSRLGPPDAQGRVRVSLTRDLR